MRKQKILSALLSLCMLFCLVLAPVSTADAANEAVQNARNGILEVRTKVYQDGDVIISSRGTGFLIGTDSGAQTIITNHHVVEPAALESEKQLKQYIEYEALLAAENGDGWLLSVYTAKEKHEAKIEIVVKRDVVLSAEVVNFSEAGDFAILKLEQPIYDRSPLQLADSSQVTATQPVYALGFPAAIENNAQADEVYTAIDVTVTDGTISKVAEANATGAPINTIVHSATISGGNSGGPLVNDDGYVVGINTYVVANGQASYFYSTEINEVSDVLRALGIEYLEAGAPTPDGGDGEDVETEEPVVEDNSDALAKLEAVVEEAEEVDVKNYTEESVEGFEDALKAAKKVSDTATVAEIEAAKGDLQDAMDALEEKAGLPIGLIAGAAAAVIVIIIVVVIVTGKSKKKAPAPQPQARPVAPVQPARPVAPVQPARPVAPMPMMNEGSEETGVLNDGSSETTVLGGGASVPPASLIRRKNNERVTVTKQVFKIGKERRKVDYCVADNTNISRTHADIVFKNGDFYIVDCNAKNGTYVNGVSVAAGQERKLMNNDTIKLADEEFQFRTF